MVDEEVVGWLKAMKIGLKFISDKIEEGCYDKKSDSEEEKKGKLLDVKEIKEMFIIIKKSFFDEAIKKLKSKVCPEYKTLLEHLNFINNTIETINSCEKNKGYDGISLLLDSLESNLPNLLYDLKQIMPKP